MIAESEEVCVEDLIDEIAMGPFGSNIKTDCFVNSGIPVFNGSNLTGFETNDTALRYVTPEKANSLGNALASRGDIVITHRGTLGQVAMVPYDSKYPRYVISQSQFRIRCNDKVLPKFFVYYFHTREGQWRLLSNKTQTGVPALGRPTSTFRKLSMPLPTFEKQAKIVQVIDAIQEKIKNNTKLNGYLEKLTSLLFDHYVDNCTTTTELCSFVNISSGKRPPIKSPNMTSECTIPLLGASGQMGYTNRYLTQDRLLVIGRVGTHGVVQRITEKAWPSDNTLIVRSPQYETTFQLLRRIDYASLNRGSTQPLITQRDLKACLVPQLDDTTLERFEREAGHLMDLHDHNAIESDRLAKLRDLLLPRLLSGDIDVSKVEGCTP